VASEAVAWRARIAVVAAVTRGAGSGEELAAVGRAAARRAIALSAVGRRRCPKPTGSVL
jgi:hypothetical protein